MKLTRSRWAAGIGTGLMLTLACSGAVPAMAADATEDTLAAVSAATPETVDAAAVVATSNSGENAIDATIAGVDVTVPTDPAVGITISSDGAAVGIGLPFAEHAASAVVERPGVLSFDNNNGSTTVPIVQKDGSVQVNTVIESSSAPTRYPYKLDIPSGGSLETDGRMAVVRDANGDFVAGVAPVWAEDSKGKDVATRLEVDGTTLTQVVDHRATNVSYPVVADPWMGANLFDRVWYATYGGDLMVNARKSAWGQNMHAPGLGQTVFWTAGWDEVKSRAPRVTEKATLRQQYDCHVGGGFLDFGGSEWNLEKIRPNRTVDWTYGVGIHHCNWSTPNGY